MVLKLKTAWRVGTTHLVMSVLEFMQRLAALEAGPRLTLICFHGALASSSTTSAKLRAEVVPAAPEPPTQATPPVECELSCAHHRPVRLSWAKLLRAGVRDRIAIVRPLSVLGHGPMHEAVLAPEIPGA